MAEVTRRKAPRYRDWQYGGKPIPGFGDPDAELLMIGLAPAAHGGTRTGRMFTGDSSGDWLVRALYETGFATQPFSVSRDDGLRLRSAYITATIRCAPPANKPSREEIANCAEYLREELKLLRNVKVVMTLGRIAFDGHLKMVGFKGRKPLFRHGGVIRLDDRLPALLCSYHPSRQNTQTGRLKWAEWLAVFRKARRLVHEPKASARRAA